MKIRDRIKELRRVRASELKPNPANWRKHPQAQQDALRGILAEVGFADAVLARELSDGSLQLIDGHLRCETAAEESIPVLVLDIDEAEANTLLATLDPICGMAEADVTKLADLLDEIETNSQALQSMLDDLTPVEAKSKTFTEQFGAPPFSVFDARQGYWQDRKREWLALGIRSELGRERHLSAVQQCHTTERERERERERIAAFKNQRKLNALRRAAR